MPRDARRLIALLTIPLLVLMSGCMRMNADYEILSDTEVRVAIDLGMLNGPKDSGGIKSPITAQDLCSQDALVDSDGMVAEEYTEEGEDGYSGCRMSGTVPVAVLTNDATSLVLNGGVWTFQMKEQPGEGDEGLDAAMFSDFRVSITFPGEVLSHTGSSTVDGTTVTWNDANDLTAPEGLMATAKGGGGAATWIWITLGALVLVGAVVAAVLLLRRNRTTSQPATAGYGQQYPGQQYPQQGFGQQTHPGHQQYPGQQPYPGQQTHAGGQPYPGHPVYPNQQPNPGHQPYPGQQPHPGQQYPPQGPQPPQAGPGWPHEHR